MKYLLTSLWLFAAFACETPIKFEEPQPKGSENLTSFPDNYQGDYLCTEDSTILKVRERHIYEEVAIFIYDEVDGLGLDTMITMQEVINEDGELEELLYLGDEPLPLENVIYNDNVLVGRLIHRDTMFSIGTDNRLRKFRGHLLLNFYRDDLDWDVVLLSQELNGDVNLSLTKMPEDLEAIQKITPVTELVTRNGDEQLLLSPTKGELRKLLNRELIFEKCTVYERLPNYDWMSRLF